MAEAEWHVGRAKQMGTELNYMYATLDIEQGDSSDDEFIPDDVDEAGDVDQVSDDLLTIQKNCQIWVVKGRCRLPKAGT
ncbi:hypothetical protein PR001_g866 [Phytophthora rubi]|uniref:Uncharacterized protein n=1 Tax=Phytophthora rubi TaxID=129364 RepID=A0A6A3P1Y8_9STRA|nr:hypothetical protein PR001_g866 [Phytophthora rubi]